MNTCPHKPLSKFKVAICNPRLTVDLTCGLMSDFSVQRYSIIITTLNVLTETRCREKRRKKKVLT